MSTKRQKSPISPERIFTVILILTFAVAAVFFLKNILSKNMQGALVIGICLAVFAVAMFLLKRFRAPASVRQIILSILLVALVLFISLNSGDYYSDDFPLFLALIALTGLYLNPAVTLVQTGAIVIALVVMYLVHPEKADSPSQYAMCVGIFVIAALINYMVIRRGRAYIDMANTRSRQSEQLLDSMQTLSENLKRNYESSVHSVRDLMDVNERLNRDTLTLHQGSELVHSGSGEVSAACVQVQDSMHRAGSKMDSMNAEVRSVEQALTESSDHIQQMDEQIRLIHSTIHSTGEVFASLQIQAKDISSLAEQLSTISFNTKLLAINASVEAARAGQHGSGFSVVANEVQTLAAESTGCSNQVTQVVNTIHRQIETTTRQLDESARAIGASVEAITQIKSGFAQLNDRFQSLYRDIQEQTDNVNHMEAIFDDLHHKVDEMGANSAENRAAVDSITSAMTAYKTHMDRILSDTRQINDLSSSLLDLSKEES